MPALLRLLPLALAASAWPAAAAGAASAPAPADVAGEAADPGVLLLRAWDLNRRGEPDAALAVLERLDAAGWAIPLEARDFPGLADRPRFRAVAAHVAKRAPSTRHAPVAYTLAERGLVAEGIAADPRSGALYVGSIRLRKIVRVGPDGRVAELVAEGAEGLGRVLGLKVDAARGVLWAAANLRGAPGESAARSGVYALDLATGARRRSVELREPGHLLNDLAIADDGVLFVTDSEAGQVLRIDPGAETPRPLVEPHRFLYPNGIVLAEGRLLVADAAGLWEVPQGGGTPRRLAGPAGFPMGGIDGLAARGLTLVGIQNGLGAPRIVELALSPGAQRIRAARVLEAGNPAWHLPTTGALMGDALVYVGNSHVDGWSDAGLAPEGFEETRLFRLELR